MLPSPHEVRGRGWGRGGLSGWFLTRSMHFSNEMKCSIPDGEVDLSRFVQAGEMPLSPAPLPHSFNRSDTGIMSV
jgi:hypothetical protein